MIYGGNGLTQFPALRTLTNGYGNLSRGMSAMENSTLEDWFAGFFDGDGSVTVGVKELPRLTTGYKIREELVIRHNYIGGLFDAEGEVKCDIQKNSNGRGQDFYFTPAVRLAQAGSEDRLTRLLEEFCDSLGVNCHIRNEKSRNGWQDTVRWSVSNRDGVETVLKTIRDRTIVKRKQIDIMLDEIIPRLRERKHTNKRGFLEVMAWKDIMDGYKSGSRGRYNLRYFEREWDMKLDKQRAGIPDGWQPDYSRPKMERADD